MGTKKQPAQSRHWTRGVHIFCAVVVVTVLSMVVPYWVALSAGIASLSFFIFGLTSLILIGLLLVSKRTSRLVVAVSLLTSLFGFVVPQLAFITTAHSVAAKLSFDVPSYLHFSGKTVPSPDKVVTYKQLGNHSLDIAYFSGAGPAPRPTVVLLHGGAWRYGSHLEVGSWPQILTNHGFNVASVEYRLSNDTYHSWRDTPRDVHDALSFLHDNTDTLDINPKEIHLLGQSAGGHLALLEAYRFRTVNSVIALYAPIDLVLDYETSRDKSAELDFIGGPPAQYAERYRALSPLNYVTAASPKTLLVQGTRDDLVATENAQRLGAVLDKTGVEHHTLLLPLTGHSFENQRGGFATQITTQNVVNFLK